MSYNFANALNDAARMRPAAAFVIGADDERSTFAEIQRRAAAAAAVLADSGVGEGSRVGLRLPNVVDFIPYYFGLLSLGAVAFLMNPDATRREIAYIVEDGGLDAVIVLAEDTLADDAPVLLFELEALVAAEEQHARAVLEPVQLSDDATALVLYTSGSTGSPKGVELTHLALVTGPMINAITFKLRGGEVLYAVLPLYHVYGISELVNAAVILGNTVVLRRKFRTADLIDAIEAHGVTVLPAVPTMLHALINADVAGRDLSSVKQVASGGAPISPEHIARVREVLPNAEYVEGYGLTETAALGTQNGSPFEFRYGSVGRAVGGVEVRIFGADLTPLPSGADHVGEIAVRGLGLMKGYLGRPEETARTMRDGWILTGDLGYLDADGYLFITGRSKDLIIRGGFNVYPVEVEHVLEAHELVSQTAVVGVPHEHYGEEIVTFVVARTPEEPFPAAALLEYVQARLSAYKCPRHVFVLPEMPLGATGKIDKIALKHQAVRLICELEASACPREAARARHCRSH